MCGIFAVLSSNTKEDETFKTKNFHKGQNRGPENSVCTKINEKNGETGLFIIYFEF